LIFFYYSEEDRRGVQSHDKASSNDSRSKNKKAFKQPCSRTGKLKKIYEDSLVLIPSPSPSVKIQIMGGKVGFRSKSKTLLCVVNKLFTPKCLLTTPSNVLLNK
jgi:hypothetical protein